MPTPRYEYVVELQVRSPTRLDPADLISLLDQLLEVGQADARNTAEDPDLWNPDATLAAQLEFQVTADEDYQLDIVCDECGESYPPEDQNFGAGPWHAESCSLHRPAE